MKSMLVCGLLFCIIGSISFVAGQERGREGKGAASIEQLIEKKYDRFKDETTVKLKPQKIRETAQPKEELSLSVEAKYKGDRPARPREVYMIFDSVSEQSLYHNDAEVMFIVDGKRIEVGEAYTVTTMPIYPNSRRAVLKLTAPFNLFSEIVNGEIVEMRLKKTEVTFTPSTIAALRAFVTAVNVESKGG